MTLLVGYKCEQIIPSIYSIKHKYIRHIKMRAIKSMQDIKYKWEMSNRKHGRFVSRFEHTCSFVPAFTTMKDFHYNNPARSLSARHLQWAPSRTLGPANPSFVPARTTHANTLACRGRTSAPSSLKNSTQREPASSSRPQPLQHCPIQGGTLGDLLLIAKNKSHKQGSYRINIAMNVSNLCEKQGRLDGENLKKSL